MIFKQIPTNDVTNDDTMNLRFMSEIWNPDRATQFTIVPSHHASSLGQWSDDDDAIIRQGDGDGAITR